MALSEHLFVQEREVLWSLGEAHHQVDQTKHCRTLVFPKTGPRVEAQVPNVNPRSSRSSKNRKPEVQELDRSPVKGEVKRKKGASLIPLTTKSGVVGQDSAGLPKSPDTLSTPKGKPQSTKKSRRYQCQICHRYLSGKEG